MVRSMERPARRRMTMQAVWLVAGALFMAALGVSVFAAIGSAPLEFAVPGIGLTGEVRFGLTGGRAALTAMVLLAAAASLLAAAAGDAGSIVLVGVTVAALLALQPFALWFFGLIAFVIVMFGRGFQGFALAALPAVGWSIMVHGNAAHGGILGGELLVGVIGAVAMLAAAGSALRTLDLGRLALAAAVGFSGLALLALGLGAQHAGLMAVLANGMIAPLLGIGAGVVARLTGTGSLDWLGGLARGMPLLSLLLLAGFAFAALLPPGPGFEAFVQVLHAAMARGDALATLVLAVWAAMMGFAALRGFAMVCLGRPRSLRAAAAEDAPRPVLVGLGLLVARGVVLDVTHLDMLVLGNLLLVFGFGIRRFLERGGPLEVPAYDDGFARPPAWLPFGDPVTQINASGFAAPFRLASGRTAWLLRFAAQLGEAMRS